MVAPWHRPAKLLSRRIEIEFKQMADETRRQQLEEQVEDHFARGEQFFQVDDLLRARREFEAILALQPDHMGAKTYLNRIDERFQGIAESFYDMAMKAFSSQDFVQAAEYAEKARMLKPDHPYVKQLLDKISDMQAQYERELKNRERELIIGPLQASAKELFDQKRYLDAIAKCDEILEVDTSDEEARRLRDLSRALVAKEFYNKGLRAARDGDFKSAKNFLREALRYKPEFPEASDLLKKISQEDQRVDEEKSKDIYRQALDAFLGGDLNRALSLAHEALSLWPENEEARRLRDRLIQRGNSPK
jgi:tetratricopeptide (TPR) repeat protein